MTDSNIDTNTESPATTETPAVIEDTPVAIADTTADVGDQIRAKEGMSSTLKTRLTFGAILMAVIIGCFITDHIIGKSYFFAALITLTTAIGLLEFYKMAKQAGDKPWWFAGTICGTGLVTAQWLFLHYMPDAAISTEANTLIMIAFLIILMVSNVLVPERKQESQNFAVTTFGVWYIAFFMSFFVKIRFLECVIDGKTVECGEALILMIFFGSKCTDIGAYLIGRKFGTVKLIPKVSPGKTVEGAVGGLFAGIAASLVIYYTTVLHSITSFPLFTAILVACLISVFSMTGDLFESLIKRRYKVKDSAALVPSFGGMLDMIDSILINAPLMYFFIISTGILDG